MIPRAPYCHQEVVDGDGFLDACNEPATTTRLDPEDGHEYPVCDDHQGPQAFLYNLGKRGVTW